ncbi:hypothetical protein QF011_000665 [Curtobacterium flaccumfaciens]|nr:hypothetical protein [Curtobacterium flaccumfaciens]MDQ0538135.1 hypothetical protein [Curtobacterium flaccumfaciens]
MRTATRIAAATVMAALAAVTTGCASTPTIYTHQQADRADAEMYEVLNDVIDATGGHTAWRYWSAQQPLDGPLTRGLASSDCLPKDWAGFSGHSMGEADGAYLETVSKRDLSDITQKVKRVWADVGYTHVDTDRSNGQTFIRATRDDPSPSVSIQYPDGEKAAVVTLRAGSLCKSYDDE